MKPGRLITILAVVALVGLLAWSTLRAQRVRCDVCVEFNGQRNCAAATAATSEEARRSAQTTACGPLAHGMDASIACDNRPPVSAQCATAH